MWFAIALLLTKVFVSILWEYCGYFPADFESAFLSGKRVVFHGSYRVAFYAHIMSGPITLLLATFLIVTGGQTRLRSWHWWAGITLLAISMLVMLPSGLVIAQDAYAGPAAKSGFTALTIITGFCLIKAGRYAALGKYQKHKKWAIRSCAVDGPEATDGYYSSASFHPGGVQIVFADGSVRFIVNSIDCGDLANIPLAADQSIESPVASSFGIWGALGTVDGLEKIDDDGL